MSDLNFLKHTRKYYRAQATKKCNLIKSTIDTLSSGEKIEYISSLKDLKSKLDISNEKIMYELSKSETEKSKLESLLDEELKTSDKYNEDILKALTLLERNTNVNDFSTRAKAPQISFPTYGHLEGESLDDFFRNFESVIEKYNFDTYTKFFYLKDHVKNEALTLITSLDINEQTYEAAKAFLTKAFASPLTQKFETIKLLSELKLNKQTNPYKFISDMKKITDSFKNLKIDSDTILQYFFLNAMNDDFRKQLTLVTNESKPLLEKINDVIFEVAERYNSNLETEKSISKKEKKSQKDESFQYINLAASINSKIKPFKECVLCKSDKVVNVDHPIQKCTVYNDSFSKLKKLESLNGCTKCSLLNHSAKECKFHFKNRCYNCQKWHFNYLCNLSSQKVSDLKKNKRKDEVQVNAKSCEVREKGEVTTSMVSFNYEALQVSCIKDSILPSFTCSPNPNVIMRCIADSGCQVNFIEEEFANINKFKTVNETFELLINGFNAKKELKTRIVEVRLNIGDKFFIVNAICIPKINIHINLPGINGIVKAFVKKGYQLADAFLLQGDETISDIKFILGTNSAHCLPVSTEVFGKEIDCAASSYFETPIGIMLMGSVSKMLSNLSYLKNNSNNSYEFSASETLVEKVDLTAKVCILNENGSIIESELQRATSEILESHCLKFLNYETDFIKEDSDEIHEKLITYVLNTIKRDDEGRIIVPLLWKESVSQLLGKKETLSKSVLNSNYKKFKDKETLFMINNVFIEQEQLGIIERVDFAQYKEEFPNYSFLAHMPVFKLDRASSKCRNVFLSNICENNPSKAMTVSHNQAMYAGPCLNKKISTTITKLRFNEKLLF